MLLVEGNGKNRFIQVCDVKVLQNVLHIQFVQWIVELDFHKVRARVEPSADPRLTSASTLFLTVTTDIDRMSFPPPPPGFMPPQPPGMPPGYNQSSGSQMPPEGKLFSNGAALLIFR
jgi:hypothetical protein